MAQLELASFFESSSTSLISPIEVEWYLGDLCSVTLVDEVNCVVSLWHFFSDFACHTESAPPNECIWSNPLVVTIEKVHDVVVTWVAVPWVVSVGPGLPNNVQFLLDWISNCVFNSSCALLGIDNLVASVILIESNRSSPVLLCEGLERHEELTIIGIDIASMLAVLVLGFW